MIELISASGRRIYVNPMTGHEERMLLTASKATQDGSNTASDNVLQDLTRKLVKRAEPELNFDTMLTGEEFDILYLIRLVSLGPLYEFRWTCPDCKKARDYHIDIRKMRRNVQRDPSFGDADPAYELRKYEIRDVCEEGILTADFTDLPSDRAGTNPDLTFILPVTKDKVVCKLPTVPSKSIMEKWMEQEDPRILSKQLAHMTISINGEYEKSRFSSNYDDRTTMERTWLRDRLADEMPGVDTKLDIKCANRDCQVEQQAEVKIAGNFFLPQRAILTTWSGSYLASVLATGDGTPIQSWISPF